MTAARPPLALVTGGFRRIGGAIAAALATQGWALALHGHADMEPEPALAAVQEQTGVACKAYRYDLALAENCRDLVQNVTDDFGRAPDLLINNASIFQFDDVDSLTPDSLQAHFALHLMAPVLLTKAVVDLSDAGAQPCIINIVDQRVRNPNGDHLSYILSKQALAESIRTLARAYGARARVNGIAPGLTIRTDDYSDAQMARLADIMPLQRLSRPADIADAVLYLANAQAVTGQLLYVDAGAHMESYQRDFLFLGK